MKKPCIVVIDDDINLRKTLADILRIKGYEVFAAGDCASGIALLQEREVSLVLVDLGLPDVPGSEVLTRVKEAAPFAQAIVLTGNASLDSAILATERGAFSYLLKPYDIDQLLLQVQRAIEKQQVEEELRLSRGMLEAVTQGITESIMLLSPDYKVLWANKTALERVGLAQSEVVGNYCYAVTNHRNCTDMEPPCPLDLLLEHGKAKTVQHVHHATDGSRRIEEIDTYPIQDAAGNITAVVHLSRDITARVAMEEELAEKVVQLEASLARVKHLEGIIPICMYCKKIRDDAEQWHQMELYISQHSEADFSHGICPECYQKEVVEKLLAKKK